MKLSIIVAHGKKREIGLNGSMPWHVSEDLKRFKKLTMGHHLLMGRKTFDSIGRPLPGRKTICLTRSRDLLIEDVDCVSTIDDAVNLAESRGESELFIAGGGEIYREFLTMASKFYLTEVNYTGDADTYFPKYELNEWNLIEKEQFSDHTFLILEKNI